MKNESRCMACQAKILWVVTERKPDGKGGKRMPVNLAPPAEGNGNLMIVMDGASATAYVIAPEKLATLSERDRAGLRISHFATCPEAQRFKGKKGTTAASNVAPVKLVGGETGFDWPDELETSGERPLVQAFTRAELESNHHYQERVSLLMEKHALDYRNLVTHQGGEFVHAEKGICYVANQSPREDFEKLRSWLVEQGLETSVQGFVAEVRG